MFEISIAELESEITSLQAVVDTSEDELLSKDAELERLRALLLSCHVYARVIVKDDRRSIATRILAITKEFAGE